MIYYEKLYCGSSPYSGLHLHSQFVKLTVDGTNTKLVRFLFFFIRLWLYCMCHRMGNGTDITPAVGPFIYPASQQRNSPLPWFGGAPPQSGVRGCQDQRGCHPPLTPNPLISLSHEAHRAQSSPEAGIYVESDLTAGTRHANTCGSLAGLTQGNNNASENYWVTPMPGRKHANHNYMIFLVIQLFRPLISVERNGDAWHTSCETCWSRFAVCHCFASCQMSENTDIISQW